jgi:hypothetical protein
MEYKPSDSNPLLQARVPDLTSVPTSSPLPTPHGKEGIRTYRWRWVVLGIFSLNNVITVYLWFMSAIVADLMICYYGITDTLLNFTTTSYMMVSVAFLLPATWFMDKCGLRLPAVFAMFMVALGASIRVIGTGIKLTP